ncbi:RNA-directed DNA polymerase from mobile element jockey [Acropora cervicornis]|uniref:RNA-directed DNA polymerase from mobile element jockey n=1 Tax=Acropora cervicornis TaxID=6130 RepID=A0AAD9VBL2_ACRCE|nr:RNA-directed DNA polymerase from mobile element jockey [Acropora cervicornis]
MNNVLDLVFVTNMNLVNNIKVYPGMSDHNCIITDINLKVKHCRKPPRTVYRFSKGNMDAVMHDLETEFERFDRTDPSSRTIDDNWNDFKTTLMSSLNKHIPRKTLSTRKDIPWMSPETKRKIRKKQMLYNKQKKTGNAEDKRKFRELRSIVKRELDIAHNQYVLNLLDTREPASEEDSGKATIGKKFWNYIKSMKREHISIASLKDVTTGEEVTHAEDFSKAFDTVPHARLLKKLEHYGINELVLGWIRSWLLNRSQRVIIDGASSNEVSVRSGVPQGTVLGPLMFLIYINDIGEHITSNLRLFADDSLLYCAIDIPQDCLALQEDLDKLSQWSYKWQMSFNVSKCKSLSITRKRNPYLHQYTMNGQELESVKSHPYLGVELTQSLNWNNHINNITTKANRSLGFIKRNLKRCPEQIKDQAYKSLVRPHVEYASSVWSPHQKYQVDKLEKVQRKAARFVKNCWIREEGVMTNMLSDLKWDSLQTRREKARLVMFYRVTHGLVDIPLPKDLLPMPCMITRNFHPKKCRPLACNTNYYMGTFFPSTVNI